ncbi:hypothetical protein MPTK1_4g03050 [Marchantia polymorpha subsp. ruderalis]|uniref:Zinc finger PHD-type domain-containing protein n=2 Tax=Marchantia polymorpha TaxID=3197 RepID=A0AAF6B5Q9_MARPO|nr:hypothetical protein MARPO_0172s0021 [Marchantia polymorpha]BBN07343.1 hypothetical protein Mp_4g03050 [Marchantia polymorpha subsp. ruderalis]|eukprot:PTQ28154.1 hypothetical protein MARPO_0172s0021 [Marchantia polymorpha]
MDCYEEPMEMVSFVQTMRKSPRPKMKASKNSRPSVADNMSSNDVPLPSDTQTLSSCETEVKQQPKQESIEEPRDDPTICVFCDDGGDNILSCEGICQRHFHAQKVDDEMECQTLGFSSEMMKNLDSVSFICENCKHQKHQCFICGELGSSSDENREVYMCHVQSCKKFYHLHCMLRIRGIAHGTHYVKQIMTGTMKLFCPRHRCDTCKIEDVFAGKLVQCRRCPRAWHADCLKDFKKSGELESTQIWKHDRFKYIYCRNHDILQELKTPKRDHVKFPDPE